jgi:hypothetical protein
VAEVVYVRTGIPREEREGRYASDPMMLQESPEGLRTLAVLGKTYYWRLNLERVRNCRTVHIYNWEGTQRIVAAIIPEDCYEIPVFDQQKVIIAFDPRTVRFETVEPPRKFGRTSAGYDDNP